MRAAAESHSVDFRSRTRNGPDPDRPRRRCARPTPTKAAEWAVPRYSELIDARKPRSRKRTAVRRRWTASRIEGGVAACRHSMILSLCRASTSTLRSASVARTACQCARTRNETGAHFGTSDDGAVSPEAGPARRKAHRVKPRWSGLAQSRGGAPQGIGWQERTAQFLGLPKRLSRGFALARRRELWSGTRNRLFPGGTEYRVPHGSVGVVANGGERQN